MKWAWLFLLVGCAGPAFESASLAISPDDGGLSEDSLTGSDGARGPGLDATSGEIRGEGNRPPAEDASSDEGSSGPPSLDSHIDDPWPADVMVERMPAPNCFQTWNGLTACCYGPNMPPVDCAAQNQAHYCEQCPK